MGEYFDALIKFGMIIGVIFATLIGILVYSGYSLISKYKISVEKKSITTLVVTNVVTNTIYINSTNK
jgi:hypothetical protein